MAGPTIPVIARTPPLSKNAMVISNDAANTTIRNVDAEKSLRIIGYAKRNIPMETMKN